MPLRYASLTVAYSPRSLLPRYATLRCASRSRNVEEGREKRVHGLRPTQLISFHFLRLGGRSPWGGKGRRDATSEVRSEREWRLPFPPPLHSLRYASLTRGEWNERRVSGERGP